MREKLNRFWRRNNQWIVAILSIVFIFRILPDIMYFVDSTFSTFSADVLNIPLIALAFMFIGITGILLYLRWGFPSAYKKLDELFNSNKLNEWENSQAILKLFLALSVIYAASVLAVSGIAAIL